MSKKLRVFVSSATLAIAISLLSTKANAQNVAINSTGTAANSSAMLDIASGTSSNKGLLIPRVTSVQKTAMNPLPAAAQGLIVYQTDGVEGFYYNTSTTTVPAWSYLTPGGWSLTGNTGTVAATNFIGTIDAIDWVIRTTNTERIRVLAGGNVGIGIAAPIGRLDVQGPTTRTGTTATSPTFYVSGTLNSGQTGPASGNIEFRHDNGTQGIGFGYNTIYQTGSNANQDLNLLSRGSSPLTLNAYGYSTGNVGIATTTPAYKLTVASGATFGFGDGTATYSSRTETRADAGLQGSAGAQSGFFQTSAPAPAANWPVGAGSWWHLIDSRHSNDANNYALQIAGSFFDQNLYFRKTNGAANTAWSQVLTVGSASTGYIQNQFAGAQTADHWVSGSSRASEVYAANWFRVDGGGGIYWQAYGGGWYMQDATWIRGYNGRSLWMGTGLIGGDGGLTIGYGGASPLAAGAIIAGDVGIGVNPPTTKLHVVADKDNLPVIYGINTNNTGGTSSYGVRGESASTGLGSAGVSGVSTNSSQNEIGVLGDYSLWGAGVFGLGWASAYTNMPSTRDFGVFGTASYSTGTGVGAYDGTNSATSQALYAWGKTVATGTKSASVPTTKGNQLLYCTESPEIWFEDIGRSKLVNGTATIYLDSLFMETVFIDEAHPMEVFIQENGECNGVYVIQQNGSFIVKEKKGGNSNVEFSYRVLAKRRFYQDHRFGVDAMQDFGDNLSKAKYVEPTTTDPAKMKELVNRATAQKEAESKKMKAETQKQTTNSKGAGENRLDGKTPRPEEPVLISKPTETKPQIGSPIEETNIVQPK